MDAAQVLDAVRSGSLDNNLDELMGAMRARQKRVARESALSYDSGDRVRLKQSAPLRPKYILGVELEVTKVNQTTATVKVVNKDDLPAGSKWAHGFRAPLEYLEPVPAA